MLGLLFKIAAVLPIVIKGIDVAIKGRSLVPKINRSSWVRLNVGGKTFLTTKHTLTATPSIFRQLIRDEPTEIIPKYKYRYWVQLWKLRKPPPIDLDMQAYYQIRRKEDNLYYIDRDPESFGVVLNFMRYRKLIYPRDLSLKGVMEEASYFQVEELVKEIQEVSGLEKAELPQAIPLFIPDAFKEELKDELLSEGSIIDVAAQSIKDAISDKQNEDLEKLKQETIEELKDKQEKQTEKAAEHLQEQVMQNINHIETEQKEGNTTEKSEEEKNQKSDSSHNHSEKKEN